MILFNIKKLENLLIAEKLTDKQAFNYLLTYLIISTIAASFTSDLPVWLESTQFFVNLIVLIWGVRKTFEINREGDNKDYFKRIISLSFVAGIRVGVFALIILFIYNLIYEILNATGVISGKNPNYENLLILGGFLIATGYYYYILLSSFKRVNAAEDPMQAALE